MKRLFLPIIALLFSLFTVSCVDKDEDVQVEKTVHILNPWTDATPAIHGEIIGGYWKKASMVQEDSCGWFKYTFSTSEAAPSLKLFRFLKGDSWGDLSTDNYGSGGIGSLSNFNVDALLNETDDVWIDTSSLENPVTSTTQPVIDGCDGGEEVKIPEAGNAVFGFPQQVVYDRGIMPEFADWTHVQSFYEIWKKEFYETSGDMGRVKFDDADFTVSEGIGYGMLIFVYMDNADNNTRSDFDKLLAYYKNFADSNGLMNWKTEGFSTVTETGSASDGDLDVALALLLAHAQWGDSSYFDEAQKIITAIRETEINASNFLKPGDSWDAAKNPSYFSFAAFREFAKVDTGYFDFWNNVIDANYNLANSAANATTGIVPNWCDESGLPVNPNNGYGEFFGDFGYDAIRTPWRLTWDWLWNGDSRGLEFASKIASWSEDKTGGSAENLRSIYTLSGSPVTGQDYTAQAAFTGAMAVSCMTGNDRQAYLNALYAQLRNQIGETEYYHTTLQVLYGLLLTGNMPNPL